MESKTNENSNSSRSINLVEGTFTPSEASDLINEMLDVKLNFHKLNRLAITEGNRNEDVEEDSSRIERLTKEKELNRKFFKSAKASGKKLIITSTIEIRTEEA